jgi:hypothetical protein
VCAKLASAMQSILMLACESSTVMQPFKRDTLVASKQDGEGERQVLGFLGVGLDNSDGEKRVTRSEYFLLVGGSAQTHERMQDTAIRFGEKLRDRGKLLHETSAGEAIELLREALED